MKLVIRTSLGVVAILLLAFALAAVASIDEILLGPLPTELVTLNLSSLTGFELSYMVIFYNVLFYLPLVFFQLRFGKFQWRTFLGLLPICLLAFPFNFFYDFVFAPLHLNQLWLQTLVYLGGLVLTGFSLALFQAVNAFQLPANELCELVGENTKVKFGVVKIIADATTLTLALSLLLVNYLVGNSFRSPGLGTLASLPIVSYLFDRFLIALKKIKLVNSFRP